MLLLLWLAASASVVADGQGEFFFSRVDHRQGLSNRAVLCLFQDSKGLMWLGTYDGVNCWDSKSMETFRSDFSSQPTLSNNVIHSISQADSSCLWISAHLGINRFSQTSRRVVGIYYFPGDYYLFSNSSGNTWVYTDDGIYYYNTSCRDFCRISPHSDVVRRQMEQQDLMDRMGQRAFVAEDGSFWLFPLHSGEIEHYTLSGFNQDTVATQLTLTTEHFHSKVIEEVFYQNGVFSFIDCDKDLYMYDISRKSKIYIRNIHSLVEKYGMIVGIIPFYEDIIVAFRANGLIRLRTSRKYEDEVINRNIRIYCIYKDVHQEMLWIGSDGQGVMTYARKRSIATNLMLSSLSPNLSRQVRSVLTDKAGCLWLGTKGDGLIRIPHFRENLDRSSPKAAVYVPGAKQCLTSDYVRAETEYQVYRLLPSGYREGFWVGADNPGLSFYSYAKDALLSLEYGDGEPPITGVHGIFEENDSTLYISTEGFGFYKVWVKGHHDGIQIYRRKHYRFLYEGNEVSMFFPLMADGDSLLWLGSRMKGLVRFDRRTEQYRVISLQAMLDKPVDDVLSLLRARNGLLYVGTTSGLVCLNPDSQRPDAFCIGREQGLMNDMIHGLLEDNAGFIWLSTNRGLVKYNPTSKMWHTYYYSAGVQIGEFSDDAYYCSPYTGDLFFGGVDGVLYMDSKAKVKLGYCSDILLRKLRVAGKEVNLEDYLTPDQKTIQMDGPAATFSLSFIAPDYLEQEELEYAYMLDGFDQKWTPFNNRSEASYTEVPAGDYTFRVICKKDVADMEYKSLSIPVHIRRPWYCSTWVWIVGCLVVCLLFYFARRHLLREGSLKKQLMTERSNKVWQSDYTEKLREFYPETFLLADHMGIRDLSDEVLNALSEDGIDISPVRSSIPSDLAFSVFKNALRCILYYCYLSCCRRGTAVGVVVDAHVNNEGRLLFRFQGPVEALEELHKLLVNGAQPLPVGKEKQDRTFVDQLLCGFIPSALERLEALIRYDCLGNGHGAWLELSFSPASTKVDVVVGEKKRLLILENNSRMAWLITGLLSKEYEIQVVRDVQTALEEINRSAPALFLVDMGMCADREEGFIGCLATNRPTLCKTLFMPMLPWETKTSVQRELIRWADAYIVLPYDILYMKEKIHKVLYGKREESKSYVEELGQMAGQFFCTSPEQKEFVRKVLVVVEQNLQREDLGSSLLADRMGMSQSNFYRRFKEVSQASPSDLIKNYRLEKAALLLQEENELSILDIYTAVGLNSRSYFYREFVRKFGKTPKDYRESAKHPE